MRGRCDRSAARTNPQAVAWGKCVKFWQREIGSWKKKTASLSFEEQGAYAAAMEASYSLEAPIPMDRMAAYKIVGAFTKKDQRALDAVLDNRELFHENGGGLHNRRADEEIQKYRVYCENQRRRRLGIKK